MVSQASLEKELIRRYGTTQYFEEAAFILRDGRMIKHADATNNPSNHYRMAYVLYGDMHSAEVMRATWRLLNDTGAVRIVVYYPNNMEVEIGVTIPLTRITESQRKRIIAYALLLRKYHERRSDIKWDVVDAGGNVVSYGDGVPPVYGRT